MEFNMESLNMNGSQGMEDGGVPRGHFSIVGLKERLEVSIFLIAVKVGEDRRKIGCLP